jgi:hypothetical protein
MARLLDLPAGALASVAAQLALDDEYAASLSCHTLHTAVATAQSRDGRTGSTTRIRSAIEPPIKLAWAISCGLPRTEVASRLAAERGLLEALIVLRERGYPLYEWLCNAAARGGHRHVLTWARANGCWWG